MGPFECIYLNHLSVQSICIIARHTRKFCVCRQYIPISYKLWNLQLVGVVFPKLRTSTLISSRKRRKHSMIHDKNVSQTSQLVFCLVRASPGWWWLIRNSGESCSTLPQHTTASLPYASHLAHMCTPLSAARPDT